MKGDFVGLGGSVRVCGWLRRSVVVCVVAFVMVLGLAVGVVSASAPIFSFEFGSFGSGNGQLKAPKELALSSVGDLYVADEDNNRIEEFNGKGEYIRSVGSAGSGEGHLSEPRGVALDSKGDVWVADTGNDRVQEFTSTGGFVRVFGLAGSGAGQFKEPKGITVDSSDHVWVADTGNNRVQEFDEAGEHIRTVGSVGTGSGQFKEPRSVAVAPNGSVWVTDTGNNRVEVFSETGTYEHTLGSVGTGFEQFKEPKGIAFDSSGDAWISDTENDRVQEYTDEGEFITELGSAGGGEGQFEGPTGIQVGAHGEVYVVDSENARVQEFVPEGSPPVYVSELGSFGSGAGRLNQPRGLALDAKGDLLVADEENDRVEKFNEAAGYAGEIGSAGSGAGQLREPKGVAVDSHGDIWVADTGNDRIEEFNETGKYVRTAGSAGTGAGQFSEPKGLAVDSHNNVWVADTANNRVEEFNEAGEYVRTAGSAGTGGGHLKEPRALAIAPNSSVWVADTGNNRVEVFSETGVYEHTLGSAGSGDGQFKEPKGITFDAHGDAWVVDTENDRVQEFTDEGVYLLQFGSFGSGEGKFKEPWGIQFGARGEIYVADTEDNRIEKWTLAGWPTNTALPSITGNATEGETLTASVGSWTGEPSPEFIYQWQMCNASGGECEDIEGADANSYTLSSSDQGNTLRVLVTATNVTGSKEASSAATATVEAGAPSESQAPSIVGIPDEGERLYADAGQWGEDGTQIRYQWQRCTSETECADIPGATSSEYLLGSADLAKQLRVRVGASNESGSVSALSPTTPTIGEPALLSSTLAPSISGTPQNGHTLTANVGSWVGQAALGYALQWERCSDDGSGCSHIEGATATTYTLTEADVGKLVRVSVQAGETEGSEHTRREISPPTMTVAASGAPVLGMAPAITGIPMQGEAVSSSLGSFSGEGPFSYTIKWQRCNESGLECAPIEGASESSHVLTSADVDSTVRTLVTATGPNGSTAGLSAASAPISAQVLVDLSTPSVAGEYHEGETLSAEPGIWTGKHAITFSYQWQRCNHEGKECANVEGATEPTYTLAEGDVENTVRVVIEAVHSSEKETVDSPVTPVIGAEATAPIELFEPELEGGATEGKTLFANPGVWAGSQPISFAYQWQRCNEEGAECSDIAGAKGEGYVLQEADVSSTVRALVTAANAGGTAETVSTSTSEIVDAPGPPENTGRPTVDGTAKQGQRLTVSVGQWVGTRPFGYAFQWERCHANGEECAAIEGATSVTYVPVSGDVGHTLRAKVSATGSLGSTGAESAATPLVVASAQASVSPAIELAQATDPSVIARSTEATLEGEPVEPQASDAGEEIRAASSLTSSSISKDTPGEFSVNTADGQLGLQPVDPDADADSMPTIVNGSAAVFANTYPATDTIVRPDPLGATTLLQLRSEQAPHSFSWELHLGLYQEAVQLENGAVAVVETSPEAFIETPPSEEELFESFEPAPAASSSSEEGIDAEEAEEEAQPEETGLLEPLPEASTATTGSFEPSAKELHPQDTLALYETAEEAMSYSESHTGDTTLMVIEPPQVLDAEGNEVSASLSIEGNNVTMTITTNAETHYPVTAAARIAAHTDKASAAKPRKFTYGLADEKLKTFESWDSKLTSGHGPLAGHLSVARRVIPYNIAEPQQAARMTELLAWLKAVREHKLRPYLTLGTLASGTPDFCETGKPCHPPSTNHYKHALELLLNRLGKEKQQVELWGAWNEPDIKREPTPIDPLAAHAAMAAEFWKIAHSLVLGTLQCKNTHKCRIVAGEFAEEADRVYIEKYISAFIKHPNWPKPSVWGFHDYHDLVHYWHDKRNSAIQAFVELLHRRLRHTQVWLSEQGVELQDGKSATALYDHSQRQREAAEDFSKLASSMAGGIELVDYYSYRGPSKSEIEAAKKKENDHIFDSGLLDGEEVANTPYDERPAYCVLVLGIKNSSCPPTAKSGKPVTGSVSAHASTVSLAVNPNGASTNYWVEYGINTEYSHSTTVATTVNPEGEQSETANLSGLEPCTTYHYQAEAENEANEGDPSPGGDQTFKTGGCSATAISAGLNSACAVMSVGSLECWGDNYDGELGVGSSNGPETCLEGPPPIGKVPCSRVPVAVSEISEVVGVGNTCAVLSGGGAYCWGFSEGGLLGDGTDIGPETCGGEPPYKVSCSTRPLSVSEISGAIQVTRNESQACALLSSGGVDCWGWSAAGELGDGPGGPESCHVSWAGFGKACSRVPVEVSGITKATAVTAGVEYTCALLATGHVDCWGLNTFGQLGDNTETETCSRGAESDSCSTVPVEVNGISDAIAIAAGEDHACAVLSTGGVDCWGANERGQLGDGTNTGPETCGSNPCSRLPVEVSGVSGAIAVAAGEDHACAVLSTGAVDCWGANERGQLGNGTKTSSSTPVAASGISDATSITAGYGFTCALLSDGAIDCWGANEEGQLGDGTTEDSLAPVPVSGVE